MKPLFGSNVVYRQLTLTPPLDAKEQPLERFPAVIQKVHFNGSVQLAVFGEEYFVVASCWQGDGASEWNWPEQ